MQLKVTVICRCPQPGCSVWLPFQTAVFTLFCLLAFLIKISVHQSFKKTFSLLYPFVFIVLSKLPFHHVLAILVLWVVFNITVDLNTEPTMEDSVKSIEGYIYTLGGFVVVALFHDLVSRQDGMFFSRQHCKRLSGLWSIVGCLCVLNPSVLQGQK